MTEHIEDVVRSKNFATGSMTRINAGPQENVFNLHRPQPLNVAEVNKKKVKYFGNLLSSFMHRLNLFLASFLSDSNRISTSTIGNFRKR